jgi:hypothetical protein
MSETTAPQLRPLGIGEVLDAGFRLVRQRFGTLLLCAVVVTVPLSILDTLVLASTNDRAFDPDTSATSTSPDAGAALAGAAVSRLIGVLIVVLVLAACFRALSAAYMGRQATAGDSLRFAFARLPALIGAYFLTTIALGVGFLLLIVPGIYLAVALTMILPALLFERIGAVDAFRRSLALVRGHWWRTLAILLVTAVIFVVLSLALGAAVGGLVSVVSGDSEVVVAVLLTLVNILLSIVLYPVVAAVLTVLYYDLRVRHEGFDLELLAEGMGREPAPVGGGGSSTWAPPRAPEGPAHGEPAGNR